MRKPGEIKRNNSAKVSHQIGIEKEINAKRERLKEEVITHEIDLRVISGCKVKYLELI